MRKKIVVLFFLLIIIFVNGKDKSETKNTLNLAGKTFLSCCECEIESEIAFKNNKEVYIMHNYWSVEEDGKRIDQIENIKAEYFIRNKNEITIIYNGIEDVFIYGWDLKNYPILLPFEGVFFKGSNNIEKSVFGKRYDLNILYEKRQNACVSSNWKYNKVKMFLKEKLNLEKNPNLHKLLLSIVDGNLESISKQLKENNGLINLQSFFGDTPLMLAIRCFNYIDSAVSSGAIEILIKNGGSANLRERVAGFERGTAWDIFLSNIDYYHKEKDVVEIIDLLLLSEKKILISPKNYSYNPKFNFKDEEIVEISGVELYQIIPEKFYKLVSSKNETLLFTAVKLKNAKIAEVAILKGSSIESINLKNNDGLTPLSLAKKNGSKEIVELLKKYGAKESTASF